MTSIPDVRAWKSERHCYTCGLLGAIVQIYGRRGWYHIACAAALRPPVLVVEWSEGEDEVST